MCSPIASTISEALPRSSLCVMNGSSIGGFRNLGEWPDEYGEGVDREPAGIFKNCQVRRTCIVRHLWMFNCSDPSEVGCMRSQKLATREDRRKSPRGVRPHRREIGGGISTLQLTGAVHPKICLRAHSCPLDSSFSLSPSPRHVWCSEPLKCPSASTSPSRSHHRPTHSASIPSNLRDPHLQRELHCSSREANQVH